MTENKERIKQEVDRTLEYMEEIDTIDPSPFFYNRIMAHLESPASSEKNFFSRFFSLSALQPALIACFIIINICTLTLFSNGTSARSVSREENLAALAEEFQLIQTDNQIKELFE